MRSLRWALCQYDFFFFNKRGVFGHRQTCTEGRCPADTQGEDGHVSGLQLQAKGLAGLQEQEKLEEAREGPPQAISGSMALLTP